MRLLLRPLGSLVGVIAALSVAAALASSASAGSPIAYASVVCDDYSNQADAQRAADTRDADGDGVYCESLPCPCLQPGGSSPAPAPAPAPAAPKAEPKASCSRPSAVQRLSFSSSKYRNIKRHTLAAIASGWPRILVLNRPRADDRRDRLLLDIPTKAGFDRDEYPPAVGRGRANGGQRGLVRGVGPVGWMADVKYVASGENRSHGASLGAKLRGLCNGTRFRFVFG